MTKPILRHHSPEPPVAVGVRDVRAMYEGSLQSLRDRVQQLLGAAPDCDTRPLAAEIASALHNVSGTAGHFGEAALGDQARALEWPLRAAHSTELQHLYCRAILAGLDQR